MQVRADAAAPDLVLLQEVSSREQAERLGSLVELPQPPAGPGGQRVLRAQHGHGLARGALSGAACGWRRRPG